MNLDVTLAEDDAAEGAAFDGLGESTAPLGLRPTVERYNYASDRLKLGQLTCTLAHDQGVIGETESLDTLGDDERDPRSTPPSRLPAGFLNGAHTPHC